MFNVRVNILLPVLAFATIFSPPTADAATVVYDVATDWSDTQNPNGVWTYTGDNGVVLTANQADWDPARTFFSGQQAAWADSSLPNPGHVPMWFRSSGASVLDVPGVGMHGSAGFTNAWVGVAWRSPVNGRINIDGGVWHAFKAVDGFGSDHRGRNSDWRLRHNGTVLASGNVSGTDAFSSSSPFSFALGAGGNLLTDIVVAAGDEIVLEFISPTSFATFIGVDLVITAIDDGPPVPPTTIYNANADWSDDQNPNGVWTYTGDSGAVLTTNQADWDPARTFFSGQQWAWADSTLPNPGHVPMWFKQSGASALDVPGVGMHGSEGSTVAWVGIVWRSPINGHIDVDGGVWHAFKAVDGFGSDHRIRNSDWRLRHNSTVLASGNVSGTDAFSSSSPFTFALGAGGNSLSNIAVAAGDEVVLEFISPTSFATFIGIELTITATGDEPPPPNMQPIADPGPNQSVRVGDNVVLDGSGSFDDNTPTNELLFDWTLLSRPPSSNAVLINADSMIANFTVDAAGVYQVQLVVTDEEGLASQTAIVSISSDNLAPTANAGPDQLTIVGSLVSLDGSSSSDPEGDPLSFSWVISSAPGGSTTQLVGDATVSPGFVPDLVGVYEVTLSVSDDIGPGEPDSVSVTVTDAAEFAEIKILDAHSVVIALGAGDVTNTGNQTALANFLVQAVVAIQEGDILEAINKLEKARARTDGCPLRGTPDANGPGRDWIVDCQDQFVVYETLGSALNALSD